MEWWQKKCEIDDAEDKCRKKMDAILLHIYYQPTDDVEIDSMVNALKTTLKYYSDVLDELEVR